MHVFSSVSAAIYFQAKLRRCKHLNPLVMIGFPSGQDDWISFRQTINIHSLFSVQLKRSKGPKEATCRAVNIEFKMAQVSDVYIYNYWVC